MLTGTLFTAARAALHSGKISEVERILEEVERTAPGHYKIDGMAFDSQEANYYKHDTLPERARQWGILSEDTSEDLAFLRDLRVKADYFEDMVHYDEASEAQSVAEGLVATLLRRKKV